MDVGTGLDSRPCLVSIIFADLTSLHPPSFDFYTCTRKDSLLSKVLRYTKQGWPQSNEEEGVMKPYSHELTIEGDCHQNIKAKSYHPGHSRKKSLV